MSARSGSADLRQDAPPLPIHGESRPAQDAIRALLCQFVIPQMPGVRIYFEIIKQIDNQHNPVNDPLPPLVPPRDHSGQSFLHRPLVHLHFLLYVQLCGLRCGALLLAHPSPHCCFLNLPVPLLPLLYSNGVWVATPRPHHRGSATATRHLPPIPPPADALPKIPPTAPRKNWTR